MTDGSGFELRPFFWAVDACSCNTTDCTCGTQDRSQLAIRDEVTAHFLVHRHGVYRYLIHRGLTPSDAEDVTQETFLRLYRVRLEGRRIDDAHALPWAIMVARRLAIDRLRRRRLEQPMFQELSRNLEDSLPDDGQSGEGELHQRERRAALARGIRELTHFQRQCLRLRAEGLSLRDTSAKVGVSERRVSEAVHRAIRRLQKFIDVFA